MIASLALAASLAAPAQAGPSILTLSIKDRGEVVVQIDAAKAPKAAAHILGLAERKFYDGLKFHRVVTKPRPYLAMFGDPLSKALPMDNPKVGTGGTGAKIPFEETGLSPKAGFVGLGTPEGKKDEGDSQFFILLADAPFLKGQHTIFGQVTKGMEVVKSIQLGDEVTSATVKRG
jgi:peptidylprolyl isomerase